MLHKKENCKCMEWNVLEIHVATLLGNILLCTRFFSSIYSLPFSTQISIMILPMSKRKVGPHSEKVLSAKQTLKC